MKTITNNGTESIEPRVIDFQFAGAAGTVPTGESEHEDEVALYLERKYAGAGVRIKHPEAEAPAVEEQPAEVEAPPVPALEPTETETTPETQPEPPAAPIAGEKKAKTPRSPRKPKAAKE